MGVQAGKEGRLAIEQNSKSKLYGHGAGQPGWPMPPRGNRVGQSGCPLNELWARTNEDKGKDGSKAVLGKDRQRRARMGWDYWSWMPTRLGESQAWIPG